MPEEAVLVSGVRTAVGKFGRSFKDVSAVKLGATVIKEAVKGRVSSCKMWRK